MSPRALLAGSWTLLIFILCWLPRRYLPEGERLPRTAFVPNVDKIVHMGIFFVFALLWMWALRSAGRARRVVVAGLVLALLSEAGQELPIVRRDASLFDWLADAAGIIVGIYAFKFASRHFEARVARPEA